MIKKSKKNRILRINLNKKIPYLLIFILFFDFVLFPVPMLANIGQNNEYSNNPQKLITELYEYQKKTNSREVLPIANDLKPSWDGYYTMTAYNSEVAQSDSSPCITANGFNVCKHGQEDTVAANFLKFGTKVKIPEIFGDRVFIVRDRMNSRYQKRVDVWMIKKQDAINFGVKIAKIVVLE